MDENNRRVGIEFDISVSIGNHEYNYDYNDGFRGFYLSFFIWQKLNKET